MSTAPPKVRESGLYWVFMREDPIVTVMRWTDFLSTWRDTRGDSYTEDEVVVLSGRLRPPEVDQGWPPEFTARADSPEEVERLMKIRWD